METLIVAVVGILTTFSASMIGLYTTYKTTQNQQKHERHLHYHGYILTQLNRLIELYRQMHHTQGKSILFDVETISDETLGEFLETLVEFEAIGMTIGDSYIRELITDNRNYMDKNIDRDVSVMFESTIPTCAEIIRYASGMLNITIENVKITESKKFTPANPPSTPDLPTPSSTIPK